MTSIRLLTLGVSLGLSQCLALGQPAAPNHKDNQPATQTKAKEIPALGESQELAHDDGISAGKRSIAGSGHAVRFELPSTKCYLTSVRLFGSRYGYPTPPAENAFVWLCDGDFKRLATFPVPYSTFQRGTPGWVTIKTRPTLVPKKFIICLGFNPTATKGVYVHYDTAGSGTSLTGLPGKESAPFSTGDWLIRAVVQEER